MGTRFKAGIAGAAGAVVAFGIAELVHGLYRLVPSVFVALAQGAVELTPGGFATRVIETLGRADIPILITSMIVCALIVAAVLANLGLKRPDAALVWVGVLAVIALAATFREPFISPVATVATIIGALAVGTAATAFLLRVAGLREASPPPEPAGEGSSPEVRVREAHSRGKTAVGRRNFLMLSGSAAVAGLAAAGAGRVLADEDAQSLAGPRPLKLPKSSGRGAQKAVTHDTLTPPPEEASIEAPGMPPLITPAADFYLIDTVLSSPQIDADRWSLKVKGAVENPIELTYRDLLSMPTREADITLSCVSNEVGGGLISNGRWTGVLLSDVLAEAGVSREKISRASEQLVGRSIDGWTAGFRTRIALDGREAMVVFGLNDSELPIKHGYPVRLIVPGLYGYVSATKWLTEIELTNWDFDAYWIQRTWSKEGPIKTQSRIDTLEDGESLPPTTVRIGGVAWAPHRGIERVEVSTDNGETWNEARLAAPLDVDTWRHYAYDWEAKPGEHTLKVRATDGEGKTQTESEAPPHPSGATGYHTVNVTIA